MITDWRRRWGDEFPFAWVQLPNYLGSQRDWPIVREQMLQTLKVPKTGMAITIDIGAERDTFIRRTNKTWASVWRLGLGDGLRSRDDRQRPLPQSNVLTEGNALVVTFDHAQGLRAREGELVGLSSRE